MASDESTLKSLCIYCYKPSIPENCPLENSIGLKNGSQEQKIFTKLISRHLKLNSKDKAYLENCSRAPCNDCLGIVTKFCELYHQLQCLELQLNWQVDKLWNVMNWADRVPSRLKSFRNTEDFERRLEFRKFFKRKCKRHFSQQSPRVSVPMTQPQTKTQAGAVIGDLQEVGVTSDVAFTETSTSNAIDSDQDKDKDRDKKTEHILLGWISSLAALIFLYHLVIPNTQNFEYNVTVERLELVNEETDLLAQVILDSQTQPSPQSENDYDDVVSSTGCFEPQQSPYNSSNNHDIFEEEPFSYFNDIQVEEGSGSGITLPINVSTPTVPLFIVEESPELLSSDLSVECGSSSQYEVPVRIKENQSCSNQESGASDYTVNGVTLVTLETQNAPNIEIGDVKLAFSSTPLQSFSSANVVTTSADLAVVPSSSSSHQKRVATDEHEKETPVFGRRSLRTKFQCSKCKATFSDVKRFETHSNSCSQADGTESEIDSEELEEEAVVKVDADADMQSDYHDSDHSSSNEGQWRSTRNPISYGNQQHNDWRRRNFGKCESESTSENESSSDEEINYQNDIPETKNRKRPLSRYVPRTCGKCDLSFSNRARFDIHNNYKHSNGNFCICSTDLGKINLTRSSLKLEGVSLEACFQCTINPDQCSRKYPLSKELEKHSKLHGQFICPICDLTVTNVLDLVDHEMEHTDEQQLLKDETFKKGKVYHCARCNYKEVVSHEIVNHYLSEHLGLPEIEAECPICQQRFPSIDTVPLTHYINYHDLNRLDDPGDKISCTEANCSAYFLREEQLHTHWNVEHANMEIKMATERKLTREKIGLNKLRLEKPYSSSCSHCHRTFQNNRSLKAHISREHVKKTNESMGYRVISKDGLTVDDWVLEKKAKFFCKVNGCKEKFREEEAFQTHSKLHGEFPCKFCKVVKTFAGDLAIHEMVHVDKLAEVKTIGYDEKLQFRCSRCPFRTGKKDRHVDHFVWKHLGLLVERKKCPVCKHGFKTWYKYKTSKKMIKNLKPQIYQHFMDWHDFTGVEGGEEGALKCDKCSAYFRTNFQLMQHTNEVHESTGPIMEEIERKICQDCGKEFSKGKVLRQHRLVAHKVELKFGCDVAECGEKFETARLLSYHHNSCHSGNTNHKKTFVCEECGETFFLKAALLSHVKCHKPKKVGPARPHVCEQCGKSFKIRAHLEVHYKFHEGPESWDFTCEVCGKKIFSKQKLTEHMRVHTKEKPFKCQVCGMAYGHRHNLRIHVNSKHKEIQDVARKCDSSNFASSRKGKKIK